MEFENQENTQEEKLVVDIDQLGEVTREGEAQVNELNSMRPVDGGSVAGLEAFSLTFSGTKFMKGLSKFMNNLTDKMGAMTSGLVEKLTPMAMKSTAKEFAELDALASRSNYATIAKSVKLVAPQKMNANWLDYVTHLGVMADLVSTIDRDVLSPLSEYLAKGINSPDVLTSNSYTPKYVERDIKKMQDGIKQFFRGAPVEHVYWGAAFRKNSEVPMFLNNLAEAKQKVLVLKPETVKKSVDTISSRAKILAAKFEQPTSGFKLSDKNTKALSDIIFYAANMVELYTIVIQLIYEIDQCVQYSIKNINSQ